MAAQPNQVGYNTNSPQALGDLNYWQAGDVVMNNGVSVNKSIAEGWICQTAGFPGVWAALAPVPSVQLTTTATSGTLTNGARVTLLNPASTGTYSLPDAPGRRRFSAANN